MAQKALRRRDQTAGCGLREVLAVSSADFTSPPAIPEVPTDPDTIKATCDSILLESFTAQDAWELGHFLYARLLPFSAQRATVISISLPNSNQVLFQTAVGSGLPPDNELWVERKRNTVLRLGSSTWWQQCKYGGNEEAFSKVFRMSPTQAEKYAIHGGGVPIRVQGVEGIVAVVVVSGLKQQDDHSVIFDVIHRHWE